ncbi:hypothetical protein GIB67_020683 [Kingdonia uniflora]|uniref:Protein kinase domain-containing protein n=1 Tax=Kingdonia uniflora TaxID=39325 RepID=A0A7J7NJM4_9MAGN|nr:hypothetical protein GIB67_020683 [Kingdonia uniflora]
MATSVAHLKPFSLTLAAVIRSVLLMALTVWRKSILAALPVSISMVWRERCSTLIIMTKGLEWGKRTCYVSQSINEIPSGRGHWLDSGKRAGNFSCRGPTMHDRMRGGSMGSRVMRPSVRRVFGVALPGTFPSRAAFGVSGEAKVRVSGVLCGMDAKMDGASRGNSRGSILDTMIDQGYVQNEKEIYFTYTVDDSSVLTRYVVEYGQAVGVHGTVIYIRLATSNLPAFKGEGCFGSIFKGALSDSSPIAVKMLEGFRQGEKELQVEVSTLGIVQYVNLVGQRGSCSEGTKRLLVYDYMPFGSLDIHLFGKNSKTLEWKIRYQIVLGTARGVAYLHEEYINCIIHCDI